MFLQQKAITQIFHFEDYQVCFLYAQYHFSKSYYTGPLTIKVVHLFICLPYWGPYTINSSII